MVRLSIPKLIKKGERCTNRLRSLHVRGRWKALLAMFNEATRTPRREVKQGRGGGGAGGGVAGERWCVGVIATTLFTGFVVITCGSDGKNTSFEGDPWASIR